MSELVRSRVSANPNYVSPPRSSSSTERLRQLALSEAQSAGCRATTTGYPEFQVGSGSRSHDRPGQMSCRGKIGKRPEMPGFS